MAGVIGFHDDDADESTGFGLGTRRVYPPAVQADAPTPQASHTSVSGHVGNVPEYTPSFPTETPRSPTMSAASTFHDIFDLTVPCSPCEAAARASASGQVGASPISAADEAATLEYVPTVYNVPYAQFKGAAADKVRAAFRRVYWGIGPDTGLAGATQSVGVIPPAGTAPNGDAFLKAAADAQGQLLVVSKDFLARVAVAETSPDFALQALTVTDLTALVTLANPDGEWAVLPARAPAAKAETGGNGVLLLGAAAAAALAAVFFFR